MTSGRVDVTSGRYGRLKFRELSSQKGAPSDGRATCDGWEVIPVSGRWEHSIDGGSVGYLGHGPRNNCLVALSTCQLCERGTGKVVLVSEVMNR